MSHVLHVRQVGTRRTSLPLSPAVIASGRVAYLSGQGPTDPASGEFVLGTFEEQAELTLRNLEAAAAAAGGSLAGAVKVNAYLRDMQNRSVFNEVYARFFPEPRPARTTVQSDLPGFEIELDAVIALDD